MRYADFTPYDIILLLQGLGVTLALFVGTTLIGLVLGLLLAIVHHYRIPGCRPVIVVVTGPEAIAAWQARASTSEAAGRMK